MAECAHLQRPRSVLHHLDALKTGSVDLAGEGRSGREEAEVDAATEVDELQGSRSSFQQSQRIARLITRKEARNDKNSR